MMYLRGDCASRECPSAGTVSLFHNIFCVTGVCTVGRPVSLGRASLRPGVYICCCEYDHGGMCTSLLTLTDNQMLMFVSIPDILGDVLVLVVTWSSTARVYRTAQRSGVKAPLATLLLRDGTLWFL
ncbi:hypothetical protein BC629DRAFT_783963 [Irpex lacteus]|nr:hypothetical protein BC629DRAFT_783963 [Irpex lacteus]